MKRTISLLIGMAVFTSSLLTPAPGRGMVKAELVDVVGSARAVKQHHVHKVPSVQHRVRPPHRVPFNRPSIFFKKWGGAQGNVIIHNGNR